MVRNEGIGLLATGLAFLFAALLITKVQNRTAKGLAGHTTGWNI